MKLLHNNKGVLLSLSKLKVILDTSDILNKMNDILTDNIKLHFVMRISIRRNC